MARTRAQHNFRKFAPLQSEAANGGLDPHKDESEKADDPTEKRGILTISQYRDPRDWLDHERHAMRAKASGNEKGPKLKCTEE